jgi:ATP-binding cassette subfamily F protein 3
VKKDYGDVKVFDHLDFIVERGFKIGLVGVNGAGKSTLMKLLSGKEKPTKGSVVYGPEIKVGYYAQHQLETLEPKDTVYETISRISSGWTENEIRAYLGSFLFSGEEITKYVSVLSGGERARLALAKMLVLPVNILFLDEPTNHLDMTSRTIIEMALAKYKGSIVCISHDRHFLNKVTNMTCEIERGTVNTYQGNYEYYEWKKNSLIQNNAVKTVLKSELNKKNDYQEQKKIKNRLAWINKRFLAIEEEMKKLNLDILDPKNMSDALVLQKSLDSIKDLENEYLDLIQEKEEKEL